MLHQPISARSPYSFRTVVTTPPVGDVVTRAELKAHLRITHASEDTYLSSLIAVAVDSVETYLGRKLLTTGMKQLLDFYPGVVPWWDGMMEGPNLYLTAIPAFYELRWLPVQAVTEIATYSRDDVRTVYAASKYRVDRVDKDFHARIALKEGQTWPTDLRNVNAHETLYTVGYGAAADIPASIKQGVLLTAAFLYQNRGDCAEASCSCAPGVPSILAQYRVRKV